MVFCCLDGSVMTGKETSLWYFVVWTSLWYFFVGRQCDDRKGDVTVVFCCLDGSVMTGKETSLWYFVVWTAV